MGRDIFDSEGKDENTLMLRSRIGMLIAIILTVFLAYILPTVWNQAIAISTGLFFGICAAAFLPMYVGALYFRNMSKVAAVSGMITGFSASMLWMMFFHKKESAVLFICNLIFKKDTIATGVWPFVDPIVIALTLSIIVTIVVSLLTKKDIKDEHIEACFKGIK